MEKGLYDSCFLSSLFTMFSYKLNRRNGRVNLGTTQVPVRNLCCGCLLLHNQMMLIGVDTSHIVVLIVFSFSKFQVVGI